MTKPDFDLYREDAHAAAHRVAYQLMAAVYNLPRDLRRLVIEKLRRQFGANLWCQLHNQIAWPQIDVLDALEAELSEDERREHADRDIPDDGVPF